LRPPHPVRQSLVAGRWAARPPVGCGSPRRHVHARRGRLECQMADAKSRPTTARPCGRAVFHNVGTTTAQRGGSSESQHCDRGHPRGARRGNGASGVRQAKRMAGRRQPLLRACHFRRFCGLSVPSRSHAWSQTSSEVATAGNAPGRAPLGCQAGETNGRPTTARSAGVPSFTMLGAPSPGGVVRRVPTL
jgi:hypothetical protein